MEICKFLKFIIFYNKFNIFKFVEVLEASDVETERQNLIQIIK